MDSLEPDRYLELYSECHSLYEQEKWAECFNLGAHNLSDQSTPRYLQIKTLILLVGAADDWYTAENFRLDAERRYKATKAIMAKAKSTSDAQDKAMEELRSKLDELLEWQANDTPTHIATNFIGAQSPPRVGKLKDFLYVRYKREHPGEDPPTRLADEDFIEEMEMEVDVEDDDLIPLEDDDAVKAADAEVFGPDQNIIQKLKETLLADAEETEALKEANAIVERTQDKGRNERGSSTVVRTPRKSLKIVAPGRFVVESEVDSNIDA